MSVNPSESHRSQKPSIIGASLSFLVPGLGQLIRGYPINALWIYVSGGILGGLTWELGQRGGEGAGWFFGMVIILPWWCLQAYDAYLPTPPGQWHTLKLAWRRAHDIRYLGGLFLLTAFTDFYIIVMNPEYNLTLFCSKPQGIPGIIAKAQSPALHLTIGFGFLRLRRWAFFVFLAYAGFGLLNAIANFACFGFGRIRTVFFFSLVAFSAYVIWRKDCFLPNKMRSRSSRVF